MEIPEAEQRMIEALQRGETVVFKIPNRGGKGHKHVYKWAKEHDRYVRIDRQTAWGNTFEIGKDGSRAEVISKYAFHVSLNDTMMKNLPTLRGKALGCHCAPEPCHGDVLVELLNQI